MRIEEIITKRTLSINEILDTRVDVKWRDVFGGMRGTNGEYGLMTKEKLSEEDKAKLDAQVTSIMAKPIA